MEPFATVSGPKPDPLTTEKLCPVLIGLEGETTPPACAIALAVLVMKRPTGRGLVDVDRTELKFPKLVCPVAWACPVEPVAVDFAWAALPLIEVADELAFAAPLPRPDPAVAVAFAFAVPPNIALEVAVALADPPGPLKALPPVA
jgi:hypothetical protein